MNTKHTPGPWHVKNGSSIYASNRYIGLALSGHLYGNDLPQEANARLMAAAPEMYELFEQMEEDLMVAWACVPEEFARKFKQYSDNLKVLKAKIEGDEH